ncbi:MAG: hypothetical protein EOP88_19260 [Verrucomicrobiaceae bacterium]|nr:MAG: hypothetical protein EOP88_19260 [Verrucomicrobiaceae bacterium]
MWPFKKKQPREEVTVEGVTAKPMARDSWEFSVDGLDFMITGKEFDPRAIQWARDAAREIRRLEPEIVKAVRESLEEAEELDLGSAKLFIVDLSEYGKDRYFSVTYVGDDSWGDMGVDVTIHDGKIISADAGD